MLKIEVEEFIKNLDLLDEFIKTNILKTDHLLSILESDETKANSEILNLTSAYKSMYGYRKKFNYSAIVIILYGYFETFLEQIIKQYVKEIVKLAENFEKLPKKIQSNHFSKSIELEKN